MLRIILETSVLHEEYAFSKAGTIELLNLTRLAGAKLTIPQIVISEHTKHLNKDRKKLLKTLKTALSGLRRLPLAEIPDFQVPNAEPEYEKTIIEIVESKDIEIIPIPNVSHEVLFSRCLDRKRPFGSDKDTGYKDALIWETLLQQLNEHPDDKILFVTNDKHYLVKSDAKLHEELFKELSQLGFQNRVSVSRTIKSASDYLRKEYGLANVTLIPEIADQIKGMINFDDFLNANINEIIENIEARGYELLIGDPISDISLLWDIEEVEIAISSTEVLVDTGEVVVYAKAVFENEINYFTFYSSYMTDIDSMEESGFSIYDSDPTSDAATVGGSIVLEVDFNFIYTPSTKTVSGFEAFDIARRFIED